MKIKGGQTINHENGGTEQHQTSGVKNNSFPVPEINKMARKEGNAHLWNHLGQTDHPERKDALGDVVQQPAHYHRLHKGSRGHQQPVDHKKPEIPEVHHLKGLIGKNLLHSKIIVGVKIGICDYFQIE